MSNELTQKQQDFLTKYTRGTWAYDPSTDLVNVKGDFDIDSMCLNGKLREIDGFMGVKFGIVSGYFSCRNNQYTSLEGAPYKTGKGFDCSSNALTSLEGAPKIVGGEFNCRENPVLQSLNGAPYKITKGSFRCDLFRLKAREWNPLGWISKIEKLSPKARQRKLLVEMIPTLLNHQIKESPSNVVLELKEVWNKDCFQEIKNKLVWPKGYEVEADLVGDLYDLGL